MEVIKVCIVLIISLIAWKISGFDFLAMCFYLEISIALYKGFLKY